jgi:hypothetical protein
MNYSLNLLTHSLRCASSCDRVYGELYETRQSPRYGEFIVHLMMKVTELAGFN